MKRPPDKEYYSILGVEPSASPEEIRDAYLSRTRVIHPDRFDPKTQPAEWKKANEMLAELNEAYSVLRTPKTRREYDELRSATSRAGTASPPPPPKREPTPPPPPSFEFGDLTPGHARFADLPKQIQERFRRRQENKNEDQFQVKLASVVRNYVFIPMLLCWFWYLFYATDGPKWKGETLLWYAGITAIVGFLLGRNVVTITRWLRATLKPFFYVTPLYFIKTEYDIVTFRPIWTLKRCGHNAQLQERFLPEHGCRPEI